MEKIPCIFILNDIRSALNVGSIFRSCEVFGIESLYLSGITASPPHPEILKTALGSTEMVKWASVPNILELLNTLKSAGWFILGLELTEQSIPIYEIPIQSESKIACIFGNEVKGIPKEILNCCDIVTHIPQYGTKHSLNVAVAAGITAFYMSSKFRGYYLK